MVLSPQVAFKCLPLFLVDQWLWLHDLVHSLVNLVPYESVQLIDNVDWALWDVTPFELEAANLDGVESLEL